MAPISVLTSVYVHFPYCLKKCPYCDFASYGTERKEVPHTAYADAVLRELETRRATLTGRTLVSVFFGGGTPSLWSPTQLGRVLQGIYDAFEYQTDNVEITVECNPTSLNGAHAAALRDAGVNRLSVGVQSLHADRLQFLGRLHSGEEALNALRSAVTVMPRVSADLIFGVHGQDLSELDDNLARLLDTGITHLSAYSLTIESGTLFGTLHRKGRLPIATDDVHADAFLHVRQHLESQGFNAYEVSNYAKPGQACRHNLHYWRGQDYLALGAGAVGCLSSGTSARRYKNEPLPQHYLNHHSDLPRLEVFQETLDPEDRIRERLMLGLRTREGVDIPSLEQQLGHGLGAERENTIEQLLQRGDVAYDGQSLQVPISRWLHLDSIVTELF